MADAEKFILLMKREPSLWDIYCPDYAYRYLKLEAWNRIGSKITSDWAKQSPESKQKTLYVLRKKWRYIRSAYIKNRLTEDKSKLLRFLDPVIGKRGASKVKKASEGVTNGFWNDEAKDDDGDAKCSEDGQDYTSITCEPNELNNLMVHPMVQLNEWTTECPQNRSENSYTQRKDESAVRSMQQSTPSFLGVNPSVAFLISCSQEMDEMTLLQQIEFKSGVLEIFKSIKSRNVNR